jgi:hypothetical protein
MTRHKSKRTSVPGLVPMRLSLESKGVHRRARKPLYGTKLTRVTEEICTISNKFPSQTLSSTTGRTDLGVGD